MIASSDAPDALLASHRREVTVLFCDLRGFTAFTEASEPEEVTAVLREYHECMGELIFRYGGTLERFLGDGIMIVFNDPLPCPDHTERAVRLALDMRRKVEEFAKERARKGHLLGFGIGIASGYDSSHPYGILHCRACDVEMQFHHLRRREFLELLGGLTVFWPAAALGQKKVPTPTIGFLGGGTAASAWSSWASAFAKRLAE